MFRRFVFAPLVIATLSSSTVRAQNKSLGPVVIVGLSLMGIAALKDAGRDSCCAKLENGALVRLARRTESAPFRRGVITAIDADSVTIAWDSAVVWRRALRDLPQLSTKTGTHSLWGKGLGIGFLTGAAIGGIMGLAEGDDPPESFFAFSATDKAQVLGGMGAIAGSVIGALIGSGQRADRWELIEKRTVVPIVSRGKKGTTKLGLQLQF